MQREGKERDSMEMMDGTKNETNKKVARSLMPPVKHAAIALDALKVEEPTKLLLREEGAVGEWLLIGLCNWASEQMDKSINLAYFFPEGE